jgi:hypothetical protein
MTSTRNINGGDDDIDNDTLIDSEDHPTHCEALQAALVTVINRYIDVYDPVA